MPISRDRGCIHCINVYGRIYEKKPYSKYCVDYNRNIFVLESQTKEGDYIEIAKYKIKNVK